MSTTAAAGTAAVAMAQDVSGRQSAPFTQEQEAAELATLTVDEIVSAEADLRGVTAGMGRLQVSSAPSIPPAGSRSVGSSGVNRADNLSVRIPTNRDLLAMEAALDKIPLSQKFAYLQACLRCHAADQQSPGTGDVYSLSAQFKSHFLEREGCNPTQAAQRYVAYWTTRLNTFGADLAYRPMTLGGALCQEVGDMVNHSVFQILPHTDLSGRAIIWFHLGQRRFDLLSEERESRILFYLYHTLCGDTSQDEIRRAGFVLVGTSAEVDRTKTSFRQQQFLGLLADVMPIHMRSGHICQPSPTFYYAIYPVLRMFMGRKWRLRTRLHYGDREAVLRELDTYGLPRQRLPTDIGGTYVLNLPRWVGKQSMKEKQVEARYSEERLRRDEEKERQRKQENMEKEQRAKATDLDAHGVTSKRQRDSSAQDGKGTNESAKEARSRIIGRFNEQLLSIGAVGGNGDNRKGDGAESNQTSQSTTLGEVDIPDEDILSLLANAYARRETTEGRRSSEQYCSNKKQAAMSKGDVNDDALGDLVDHLDEEAFESLWDDCDLLASDETKDGDGTLLG